MKKITSIATMFIVFTSCNQKETDTKAEGVKLMQVSREWSQQAATRDVEKILSYWADDAVVLSAGEPPLNGKAAIRRMIEGSFKNPGFQISWEPKTADISKSGDMGYLLEDSKITVTDSTGKRVTQNFKTVTVWKKQSDGSWKAIVDVMSPAPSPKD